MIARILSFAGGVTAIALLAATAANAQPAAGVPAGFSVARSAGGYEAVPPPGSLPAGAPQSGDSLSSTASPPLGPQDHLGMPHHSDAHYIALDTIAPPIVYGQYTTVSRGFDWQSYAARGAFEFHLGSYKVMAGADARRWSYPSTPGVTTGLAGQGRGFVPAFAVHDYDVDEHVGLLGIEPRIYAAVSYLTAGTNADAPQIHGLGYGLEKLVDSDRNFSLHGSFYWYPNVGGTYTVSGSPAVQTLSYREYRYAFGATIAPLGQPFFLDAGFMGEKAKPRTGAPVGFNRQGPYVGLGIRF